MARSGIGEAMVRAFAGQGARVAFVDMAREAGERLEAHLNAVGHDVSFTCCDITRVEAYQQAIRAFQETLGPITVLINNAANDVRHTVERVDPERFDQMVSVNLKHAFFAVQAVAPMMRAAGGGSIINLGSIGWMTGSSGYPVYAASKAATHGMSKALARELGPDRIRVNTLVPGWVMTERQKALWASPESLDRHRQRQCLPDLIEPVYLARMVLFLASDDAAMCTANNYMVEAGSI